MKRIAIGILNYDKHYEVNRCIRMQKEMNICEDSVFSCDDIGQIESRQEEYIAFWDAYDIWDKQKLVICMSHIAESDADVIIHSYIQHIGLKGIPYKLSVPEQDDIRQVLYQGLPGISAIIFRREWLIELLFGQKDIVIGAEAFYQLLFKRFTKGKCSVEFIPQILSENWSYYGSKTPSVTRAKDNMLKYWNTIDFEPRNSLLIKCYEYYKNNFGECPLTEFYEGVSMDKDELEYLLQVREETLSQQIQIANCNSEKKNDFYLFMRDWVELHQAGGSIADKLVEEGVSTVAIYGAGKHGKMLFNELRTSKVKVIYWIDKNSKVENIEECPVIGMDSEFPHVDAVIITPYREFQSIENSLKGKTKAKMIPLDTLVRR